MLPKTTYQITLYSLGNVLLKFVGILLLPLYTSVFKTTEFGIIGLVELLSLIITTVLSLNLSQALVRWLSDEDQQQSKSIVFTVLLINVSLIIVFSLFTFPFLKQISELFFKTDIYKTLILLMFISIYIDILNRIPLSLIRSKEKPVLYIVSMVIKCLITLVANIYLIKYTYLGIASVLVASILGNLAFFICTFPLLIKNIYCHFLKHEVPALLRYSVPLIFVGLGSVLLNMGDRYVLNIYSGLGEVGIYSFGYKVASIVNMFVLQGVNLAVLPLALKSFDSETGVLFLRKIMSYLTIILCFMFVAISLLSLNFLHYFTNNQEYLLANKIIPVLLFAYIFDGVRILYSYHILYVKKTLWNAYLTIFSAILNIGLNFIVVPKYGFIGAAYTTLLTSMLTYLTFKKVAQKMVYVKYDDRIFWGAIIIAVAGFVFIA